MRHLRTTLAALLITIAGTLGATPAQADDSSWAVRTAANDFGDERTSYAYALDPGNEVHDALVVTNHGTEALTLAVYASDGYTTDAGQLDLLTTDQQQTGVGAWVSTDQPTVSVEPGATAEVPFTVAVPADASPGDYLGGIVTSLTQPDDSANVNVDRRLGITLALRVGGALAPGLAVEDVHVGYAGTANPVGAGEATVTYTLHNTGNTAISAQGAVAVTGPFGRLRHEAVADEPPTLLPGESWTVSVPVPGVVPAFWLAGSVSVTPLVTDVSGSTSALSPVLASAHGWAVPWTASALVLVLAGAALLVVRLARRRRRAVAARQAERVQAAVEQALRDHAATPAASPTPSPAPIPASADLPATPPR